MTIIQINASNFGSTGSMMLALAKKAREKGQKVYTCVAATGKNYGKEAEDQIVIGNRFSRFLHLTLGYYTGFEGCFSYFSTLSFLRKIKKLSPDVIHLHNLHVSYINLPLLFSFIKKNRIRTVWTLHDCWSFTGHCPHFQIANCEKWKEECFACPSYRSYPKSFLDNARKMHRLKKKWFLGVEDLTIVTPSRWLSDLVKESFLKDYPVKVLNNGIDLSVFTPRESDFKEKYGLENKKVLLGVSMTWGERKGLDVFCSLAKRLPDDYRIVLVGTNDAVDAGLPENIISIHNTKNREELAEIYSAADLFVNPTREENYPTVNMEAIACGTPVLTFRTGGSTEIPDETSGAVVEKDDFDSLVENIVHICEKTPFSKEEILERAKDFNENEKYKEYLELYEK